MKKTIYSLVLDENLVKLVDELAKKEGLSRSTLVGKILGEYVGISGAPKEIVGKAATLAAQKKRLTVTKKSDAFIAASSINYKYMPKITYTVAPRGSEIAISVFLRSQSDELMELLDAFFRLYESEISCEFSPFSKDGRGKYVKTSVLSEDDGAAVLADYLENLNRLINNFVGDFPTRREEKLKSAIRELGALLNI